MKMEGYERLKEFLIKHIEKLKFRHGVGIENKLPDFDLFPMNYLIFAENELDMIEHPSSFVREKINCILHLKRALDCQLDLFFFTLGFSDYLKKKNLGINSKLQFLQSVGVIKSRTIARFNKMRNKIEHHYKIPDVEDVEVYFDLISALIANIEMTLASLYSKMVFSDPDKNLKVKIQYNSESIPGIYFEIHEHEQIYKYEVNIEKNLEEFMKIFKIYILLAKRDTIMSPRNNLYITTLI
jgi:hypothetical protein